MDFISLSLVVGVILYLVFRKEPPRDQSTIKPGRPLQSAANVLEQFVLLVVVAIGLGLVLFLLFGLMLIWQ